MGDGCPTLPYGLSKSDANCKCSCANLTHVGTCRNGWFTSGCEDVERKYTKYLPGWCGKVCQDVLLWDSLIIALALLIIALIVRKIYTCCRNRRNSTSELADGQRRRPRANPLHHPDQLAGSTATSREVVFLVGCIIGSGIFVSPGFQGAAQSLCAWIIAGSIYAAVASCLAELYSREDDEYTFVRKELGPIAGFLRFLTEFVIVRPCIIATISLTISAYMLQPYEVSSIPVKLFAAGVIVSGCAVTMYSTRFVSCMLPLLTFAKILAMSLFTITALLLLFQLNKPAHPLEFVYPPSLSILMSSMPNSIANSLWCYGYGQFRHIRHVAKRGTHFTKSLLLSLAIATSLFALTSFAYTLADGPFSSSVALSFSHQYYPKLDTPIVYLVTAACLSTMYGILSTAHFLPAAAAKQGQVPMLLTYVHIEWKTPIPSIIMTAFLALLYVLAGDIQLLIQYVQAGNWVGISISIGALLWARTPIGTLDASLAPTVKAPLMLVIVSLVVSATLSVLPFCDKPIAVSASMGLLIISAIPYYFVFLCASDELNADLQANFIALIQRTLMVEESTDAQ